MLFQWFKTCSWKENVGINQHIYYSSIFFNLSELHMVVRLDDTALCTGKTAEMINICIRIYIVNSKVAVFLISLVVSGHCGQ